MSDIVIPMTIGDRKTEVILSSPNGGTNGYHIMIGNIYHGTVNKMLGGWKVNTNPNSELTAEDFEVILEAVRKAEQ